MLRPSSLPILAECPQFESAGGNEYTLEGQARHDAVNAVLRCDVSGNDGADVAEADACLTDLQPEDRESVQWACDYIRIHAPMSDYRIRFNTRVYPIDENFAPLFPNGGEMDIDCGPELFDLKSRYRDYWSQLACYALAKIQNEGFTSIRCHALFMIPRRHEVRVLTEADCWSLIKAVTDKAGKGVANPCSYCGWCSKQLTCEAVLQRVNAVVAGRPEWELEQYHSTEIKTAQEMGKALRLARQINKWCEAVEHFAREMAQKQGQVPEGFEVKTSKGRKFITDAAAAFPLTGLDQDTFLRCCEVRQNTSKKYKNKLGLANALADRDQIPLARAKRILTEKLSPVLSAGTDGIKLVSVKGDANEDEGEE